MGNAIFMGGNTSQKQDIQVGNIIYATESPGENYIDLYEKGSYGNNYIPIEPEYNKLLQVSSNYYPNGYEITSFTFNNNISNSSRNLFCFLPENNYMSYVICGDKIMCQSAENGWEQYEHTSTILPASSSFYGYIRKHDNNTNKFQTIGITLSSIDSNGSTHKLIIHDNITNSKKIKTYKILIDESLKSNYSLQGIYMFEDWAIGLIGRRSNNYTAYISIFKDEDFQKLQNTLTNNTENIEINLSSTSTISFSPSSSHSNANALKFLGQNENNEYQFILYYRSNIGRGATTNNYFYYMDINVDSAKENISYKKYTHTQANWTYKTLNDWENANKLSVYMFRGGSSNNSTIKMIDITLNGLVENEKVFERTVNQNPNSQINLQTGQMFQFLHNGLYYNFRANNINLPQEFFNITKINQLVWESENIQNISSLNQEPAIILENINNYEEIYKILRSSYKVGYLNNKIYIASPQFKKCYPQIPISLSLGEGYRPYIKVR